MSELEEKQNKARIEWGLTKERCESMNSSFEVKQEVIDFLISTEQGCDMLMSQCKALNEALDRISSPKKGNHKRDNDII